MIPTRCPQDVLLHDILPRCPSKCMLLNRHAYVCAKPYLFQYLTREDAHSERILRETIRRLKGTYRRQTLYREPNRICATVWYKAFQWAIRLRVPNILRLLMHDTHVDDFLRDLTVRRKSDLRSFCQFYFIGKETAEPYEGEIWQLLFEKERHRLCARALFHGIECHLPDRTRSHWRRLVY
jgi:hypothetical protein